MVVKLGAQCWADWDMLLCVLENCTQVVGEVWYLYHKAGFCMLRKLCLY